MNKTKAVALTVALLVGLLTISCGSKSKANTQEIIFKIILETNQ